MKSRVVVDDCLSSTQVYAAFMALEIPEEEVLELIENPNSEVVHRIWQEQVGPYPTLVITEKDEIPFVLRSQVLERDDYRCVICGTPDDLSMDHIYPESLGGETVEANLQTMCRPCNSRKGAKVAPS